MPNRFSRDTDGTTTTPTTAAPADVGAALSSAASSHPRLDALLAHAPSVADAAAGVHPHPDGADGAEAGGAGATAVSTSSGEASGNTPLVFPLPPLDDAAWTHPLFPGEHSVSGPQGIAPPVQVTPPAQSRVVDVLAALVIDLAVLALLGYLVARGHLRIDFAGLMALVGLVLHHRRAVPAIPRLFPK